MRNVDGPRAALTALPGGERLSLHAADMAVKGAFDDVVKDVDGVIIASLIPTYLTVDGVAARELDDKRGWAEIIQPTVDGCLNIMHSAIAAGIKDIVICSSTSSTNPTPPVPVKNEVDHWSDVEQQCADKKYTSAAKTVMEHEAMALAAVAGVRLRILLPTIMLGPPLLLEHATSGVLAALKRMLRGEKDLHDVAPNDSVSMTHIDDIAALFMAAYESPTAEGRYYAVRESWHWNDVYRMLKKIEPSLAIPPLFEGEEVTPTQFDFTRRDSLGIKLRDIPDILTDAVAWAKANT